MCSTKRHSESVLLGARHKESRDGTDVFLAELRIPVCVLLAEATR